MRQLLKEHLNMPSICFYFQVHQPKRLRKYTIFDINNSHHYEDETANSQIMQKVANKCYLPMNQILLDLIHKHQGHFKIAFSISGVAIEQMKLYSPETLESFKRLVKTGCVELLGETYYHSLSAVFSETEFRRQIRKHKELMLHEFNYETKIFRNTELIYNDNIARIAEDEGFQAIITEGTEKILGWKSPNFVYKPVSAKNAKLLLKNYSLSDDIAFRFSNQAWNEFPLNTEKYSSWIYSLDGNAETINLFMDYETFGEHQWQETGIFEFMKVLPERILQHPSFSFNTPSEVIQKYEAKDFIASPNLISWADTERDLSAWMGNHIQDDSLEKIYSLEKRVYNTQNNNIIETWESLLTSDHFYYMCTKYFSDGDVHKYFNPYNTPYEAYINYQNVFTDFENRLIALEKANLKKAKFIAKKPSSLNTKKVLKLEKV
jgi:alpha-amylase